MERLTFTNDPDSAHRLDEIMYSYQGWDSGTVMADTQSLSLLLFLLERREIVITEHVFPYDHEIRNDKDALALYSALAPKTRWKQSTHTEAAGVRINALKQMRQVGVPFYDDYICYQDGRINVHCGNIGPSKLLAHLARHPELRSFLFSPIPIGRKTERRNITALNFPVKSMARRTLTRKCFGTSCERDQKPTALSSQCQNGR